VPNRPQQYRPNARKVRTPETRPSAAKRGYGRAWQKSRKDYLREHPLCVECDKQGLTVPATEVDHIDPHQGDEAKFWDRTNWQGLCDTHHAAKTAKEERAKWY
jgi:5-methylcytosine-specific restriction protein A